MLPERPVAGEVINVRSPAKDDRADVLGIHRPQQPLLTGTTKRCFQHGRHFIAAGVLRTGFSVRLATNSSGPPLLWRAEVLCRRDFSRTETLGSRGVAGATPSTCAPCS